MIVNNQPESIFGPHLVSIFDLQGESPFPGVFRKTLSTFEDPHFFLSVGLLTTTVI